MKKFIFVFLFIVFSGTIILYGNVQYKNKLNETNQIAQAKITGYQAELKEQALQSEHKEQEHLEGLVGNLTPELKEKVLQAFGGKEPLQVVAMGSRALTGIDDTIAWPEILEEQVNMKYGEKIFNVETHAFGKDNTFVVVENDKHLDVAKLKPDILIIEPFIWNNHGYAMVRDTLYHIGQIVRAAKEENEDIVIFIQPPNPIYKATIFQEQVESVKEYSLENGLLYLDHWEDWPDTSDELLKNYIVEDDYIPNQSGHELWAEYIVNYFVGG